MQEQTLIRQLLRRAVAGAALLLLSACATPHEQSYVPPSSAPEIKSDVLDTGNGAQLPLHSWLPEGKPKALLLALHGFNDYGSAFEGAGEYFRTKGVGIFAYDQRGFGASAQHGIWAGRKNLVSDIKQLVIATHKKYPGVPVFLMGESMGGAVAIVAVTEPDFPQVSGVILSAPAVWGDQSMNSFYRTTLWLMAHMFPGKELTGQDLKIQASDNIPMLIALGRDPLVIKAARVDAIYGIVSLMDEAYRKADQVRVPVLYLYGAKDQVIPRAPVHDVVSRLQAPFTLAYYPNGYHMLMRDLRARTVLEDINSWLENRYRVLPSGYDCWGDRF